MDPEGVLRRLQILTIYAEKNSTHYPDIVPKNKTDK